MDRFPFAASARLVFVAHDLTRFGGRRPLRGVADAAIGQDLRRDARRAIRMLHSLARDQPNFAERKKIRTDIAMSDDLLVTRASGRRDAGLRTIASK